MSTLYPLGLARQAVEEASMEISHVWEDLLFLSHNAFLLQFSDQQNHLVLHTNNEANEEELQPAINLLVEKFRNNGLRVSSGGKYQMRQVDGENLELEFL